MPRLRPARPADPREDSTGLATCQPGAVPSRLTIFVVLIVVVLMPRFASVRRRASEGNGATGSARLERRRTVAQTVSDVMIHFSVISMCHKRDRDPGQYRA